MALDNKKKGFGFDIEERLQDKPGIKDTPANTDVYEYQYGHTDTHTDAPAKENKSKRTYGLVQPSVFEKITKYAKANNTSYNDIVCELLDRFIDEKGL